MVFSQRRLVFCLKFHTLDYLHSNGMVILSTVEVHEGTRKHLKTGVCVWVGGGSTDLLLAYFDFCLGSMSRIIGY